jgi:hypothetical protein
MLTMDSFHSVYISAIVEEEFNAIVEEVHVELVSFESGGNRVHDAVDIDGGIGCNGD